MSTGDPIYKYHLTRTERTLERIAEVLERIADLLEKKQQKTEE
jgi:hypothetical protein